MVTVMRPMLKAEPLTAQQGGLIQPVLRVTALKINHSHKPSLPSQIPILTLSGEKQWLSVLLRDTSVTTGVRTHIMMSHL